VQPFRVRRNPEVHTPHIPWIMYDYIRPQHVLSCHKQTSARPLPRTRRKARPQKAHSRQEDPSAIRNRPHPHGCVVQQTARRLKVTPVARPPALPKRDEGGTKEMTLQHPAGFESSSPYFAIPSINLHEPAPAEYNQEIDSNAHNRDCVSTTDVILKLVRRVTDHALVGAQYFRSPAGGFEPRTQKTRTHTCTVLSIRFSTDRLKAHPKAHAPHGHNPQQPQEARTTV
jgi:hypothetical protein